MNILGGFKRSNNSCALPCEITSYWNCFSEYMRKVIAKLLSQRALLLDNF